MNLAVIAPGKGTLAADESCGTIKRLDAISALIRGAIAWRACATDVWVRGYGLVYSPKVAGAPVGGDHAALS